MSCSMTAIISIFQYQTFNAVGSYGVFLRKYSNLINAMARLIADDFQVDDDACNVTNPLDIILWSRRNNLKLNGEPIDQFDISCHKMLVSLCLKRIKIDKNQIKFIIIQSNPRVGYPMGARLQCSRKVTVLSRPQSHAQFMLDAISLDVIHRCQLTSVDVEENHGWDGDVEIDILELLRTFEPATLIDLIHAHREMKHDWRCADWLAGRHAPVLRSFEHEAVSAVLCHIRFLLAVASGVCPHAYATAAVAV